MITNNFNSTHETSNNPIVNAYQSILSERLMHILNNRIIIIQDLVILYNQNKFFFE